MLTIIDHCGILTWSLFILSCFTLMNHTLLAYKAIYSWYYFISFDVSFYMSRSHIGWNLCLLFCKYLDNCVMCMFFTTESNQLRHTIQCTHCHWDC